jgi:hypothetical protein
MRRLELDAESAANGLDGPQPRPLAPPVTSAIHVLTAFVGKVTGAAIRKRAESIRGVTLT